MKPFNPLISEIVGKYHHLLLQHSNIFLKGLIQTPWYEIYKFIYLFKMQIYMFYTIFIIYLYVITTFVYMCLLCATFKSH